MYKSVREKKQACQVNQIFVCKENRETKIKHLKQFLKFYPILLYSFFNEI